MGGDFYDHKRTVICWGCVGTWEILSDQMHGDDQPNSGCRA